MWAIHVCAEEFGKRTLMIIRVLQLKLSFKYIIYDFHCTNKVSIVRLMYLCTQISLAISLHE